MQKYFLTGLILVINSISLNAQNRTESFEREFGRAERIFNKVYKGGKDAMQTKETYSGARIIYLDLYKQDTMNSNIAFKLGVCCLASRKERPDAISYFRRAVSNASGRCKESSCKEKKAPIIAFKFLGDAYHFNYEFDKAVAAYEKFISMEPKRSKEQLYLVMDAKRQIEMCKNGKELKANPVNIKIENMGAAVNSSYPDYSPVLSADGNTLFFTSRRPETTGMQKDEDGNYMEDIYFTNKTDEGWSKAANIGASINTIWHEATVGLSPDAQTILIYKDDKGDGNIYAATLMGEHWTVPVKLNENINSKYWEPSASISADGSTLYFTSDRPGGYGGRDLYFSKREPGGDWGKAVNMGAVINTRYDEDAPFIHSDGFTLSFSSKGHNSMGGFDIFTSVLSDKGNWTAPVNEGYPVNTTDDDIFYVVSPDNRKAYLSSYREDGFGEKDNYEISFLDRKEAPLTLMKGLVIDETGKPAKTVEITVTDNETGKVAGIYHSNSKSGKFLFILIPGKNYNITYEAEEYLFYSENMEIPKESNYYEINRVLVLKPIVVGAKITLNNIFFDYGRSELRSLSDVELNNVAQLLKNNPKLKVEISGHTDNKGDDDFNQKLSEARARAVVEKLSKIGISSDRMEAKGYGKTRPVAENNNADGTDNPEGRQLNRRVEFEIIDINFENKVSAK